MCMSTHACAQSKVKIKCLRFLTHDRTLVLNKFSNNYAHAKISWDVIVLYSKGQKNISQSI